MRRVGWGLLMLGWLLACEDPADPDAGPTDAGASDRGVDAATSDGGQDAGPRDNGTDPVLDAAPSDAEPSDAGVPLDAEPVDASPLDAMANDAADAGPEDAELPDAAPLDLGVMTTSTSSWSAATGTPDTACTPWLLVDTATPEDPAIVGSALVLSTSADGENLYYYQPEADLIVPAVLRLEARVRLVSGSNSTPSRGPVTLGFRLGADQKKNLLQLRDGEAFLLASENVLGPSVSVPTSDAPHDYVMVADLNTGAIEVFQDGVSILTGSTYPEPTPGAPRVVLFGEASLFANGSSEWYRVTHNAHAPTTCP